MSESNWYTLISVVAISLVSLIGIAMLVWKRGKWIGWLSFFTSFAAGALLGDVFLHILPELAESTGEHFAYISGGILVGILLFFLLERWIHTHHSHSGDAIDKSVVAVRYMVIVGDSLHNFLDGLVIAAAFQIDISVGIATALAVLLHELPQEIGDFALLVRSGFTAKKALAVNFYSALFAVVGAGVGLTLGSFRLENWLIALAAASFLYIAMGDLIPAMHKDIHTPGSRWWKDILMLIIGGLVMALLLLLE